MIILFLFIIFVALLNKFAVNIIISFTLYFFSEITHYLFLGIIGILLIFLAWCFSDD
jgi:hypothetical protein